MIIEGLLTTQTAEGQPHVAPMGPVVDADLNRWLLRPFQTSNTFRLLRGHPKCVFHVVDDVLIVVRSVLDLPQDLEMERIPDGWVIQSACHWYQLEVMEWDVTHARAEAAAVVVAQGVRRPFWGWNRAKHAILEASILVTRLDRLQPEFVHQEFLRLKSAIDKTAGAREKKAWELLNARLMQYLDRPTR